MSINKKGIYTVGDGMARKEAQSIVHAMKHGVDMSDVFDMTPDERLSVEACYPAVYAYREKVREYVDMIIAGEDIHVESEAEESESEAETPESAAAEADSTGIQGEEESASPQAEASEGPSTETVRSRADLLRGGIPGYVLVEGGYYIPEPEV